MKALALGHCHLCGQTAVEFLPQYAALRRVTSDCQEWPMGGQLGVCRACGGVQESMDARWQAEIERIYKGYAIYHQSLGVEQAVFAEGSGQALARSERLLQCLQSHIVLPKAGRWLDVGCGNGALLRAGSQRLLHWSLAGQEINDKYKAVVESIARVEALHTCPPTEAPGQFDVISLIHVLEHIPEPGNYLAHLAAKLAPDGLLLIEVPNHEQNPFDLLIADHASHFSALTLAALVEKAGYAVVTLAADWVLKELTLVARRSAAPDQRSGADPTQAFQAATQQLTWLNAVVASARRAAEQRPFGLFGTSIAATWLFGELESQVDFFVDEDPARAGKTHLNRPIYAPGEAPPASSVFIALPPRLAENVKARLETRPAHFHCVTPPGI